jgi:cytoplasmic polyadenylation element-binding protein
VRVEWPGKSENTAQPKGYVYIIFESERQVNLLLSTCVNNGENFYYKISSKRIKSKEVEVIPWNISDSNYIKSATQKLDATQTVFVGGLHGKIKSRDLAKIFDDLFDDVSFVGFDTGKMLGRIRNLEVCSYYYFFTTDKWKYPIGSARVTFNSSRSYMKAVSSKFIEIKTSKFTKKLQIDPYLIDDAICSKCKIFNGPYFCRELICFRYFCAHCWKMEHQNLQNGNHKPLTRNSKSTNDSCYLKMNGPI